MLAETVQQHRAFIFATIFIIVLCIILYLNFKKED